MRIAEYKVRGVRCRRWQRRGRTGQRSAAEGQGRGRGRWDLQCGENGKNDEDEERLDGSGED